MDRPKNILALGSVGLVNDVSNPGPDKVYGTDASGIKGWKNDPAGGGNFWPLGGTATLTSSLVVTSNTGFQIIGTSSKTILAGLVGGQSGLQVSTNLASLFSGPSANSYTTALRGFNITSSGLAAKTPGYLLSIDNAGNVQETMGGSYTLGIGADLTLPSLAAASSQTYMLVVDDAGKITSSPLPASSDVFQNDVTFSLSSGKSFGKYTNGDTASWSGLSAVQALEDAAVEYINPFFSNFTVSGDLVEEVGASLSGDRDFGWSIQQGSGTVSTIDIYDITDGSTLVSGTTNDGSHTATINTIQLTSEGATQQWRGIGNNSSPVGTFNSSTVTVIARYKRFAGASSVSPDDSAKVRALPTVAFVSGGGTFTFSTGTTEKIFSIALPPGRSLVSVVDQTALGTDITSEFVSDTVEVLDAGSTAREYEVSTMTADVPYNTPHTFQVTYS